MDWFLVLLGLEYLRCLASKGNEELKVGRKGKHRGKMQKKHNKEQFKEKEYCDSQYDCVRATLP